jgi:signal transduction histidine kinase/ActR/RegA family two-component response regulator
MSELLVAVLLVVTAFLFSLELRRRRIAETRLQETLASVEQQVADRTDALSQAMAEVKVSQQRAEEANHLKDEFLSTASHELRTPLNAIVGWVHLLQTGALQDPEQQGQAIGAIARNAKIQTRLIEDLLDVSRMMQGRVSLTVTALDLRSLVHAAVTAIQPAAAAKGVTVVLAESDVMLPVVGDAQRLEQIAFNLLANALKYTPSGGRVDVTVTHEGNDAVLRVTDTGEGIDPQFLPHVFEPFRQGVSKTTRSGLGLGLAIVQRLVELHRGRITAESEGQGLGARFEVSIPLAYDTADAASTDAPASPHQPLFDHLHVLVAEDDADSAAAVTAILRLHGCETQTAGTASECLRITRDWPPDVLVCDVGLPDDDGYGLLRRLRLTPAGETLPAIALTAYTRPEDRSKALAAGFRAHLSKPLDPEKLLQEISAAVKDRSAA